MLNYFLNHVNNTIDTLIRCLILAESFTLLNLTFSFSYVYFSQWHFLHAVPNLMPVISESYA